MRTRPLGRTGLQVSEIGFGGWPIGGSSWGGPRDDDSRAALERAVEHGCTFFETALVYGLGHSEELIGEVARAHPHVTVATKVPPRNLQWPARPGTPLAVAYPPEWITACCELSVRNLGRPVDLLQLHTWTDEWTDAWLHDDEWRRAFERLRASGKIRHAGVSLNTQDPGSGVRLVRTGQVDTVQVAFNLFDQSPEDELLAACAEHGVGVIARQPFDEGALTGKFTPATRFPFGDFRNGFFGGAMLAHIVGRVEAVRPVLTAAAHSMARGALRFCLSQPAVSTVIVGTRSPAQADENFAASDDGPLPAETIAALRAFRWVRPPY